MGQRFLKEAGEEGFQLEHGEDGEDGEAGGGGERKATGELLLGYGIFLFSFFSSSCLLLGLTESICENFIPICFFIKSKKI